MKALIFDSGTLINLSMNGLLYILEKLKKNFNGKFLITEAVKFETIDKPIGIPRFELGALIIKNLLDAEIIEMPNSVGISYEQLKRETAEMLDLANHYVNADGKWISIVSEAEMSCLAFSNLLAEKGVENIIAIDERTTRILGEKPENLENLMSSKLHQRVEVVAKNFRIFAKYRFIRSSELVYVAYKKGLINLNSDKALEALLFATKYKGSSISFDEINILKKM